MAFQTPSQRGQTPTQPTVKSEEEKERDGDTERARQRERAGERERQRDRERQREKERERETERQRERKRERERERARETERQREREISRGGLQRSQQAIQKLVDSLNESLSALFFIPYRFLFDMDTWGRMWTQVFMIISLFLTAN